MTDHRLPVTVLSGFLGAGTFGGGSRLTFKPR